MDLGDIGSLASIFGIPLTAITYRITSRYQTYRKILEERPELDFRKLRSKYTNRRDSSPYSEDIRKSVASLDRFLFRSPMDSPLDGSYSSGVVFDKILAIVYGYSILSILSLWLIYGVVGTAQNSVLPSGFGRDVYRVVATVTIVATITVMSLENTNNELRWREILIPTIAGFTLTFIGKIDPSFPRYAGLYVVMYCLAIFAIRSQSIAAWMISVAGYTMIYWKVTGFAEYVYYYLAIILLILTVSNRRKPSGDIYFQFSPIIALATVWSVLVVEYDSSDPKMNDSIFFALCYIIIFPIVTAFSNWVSIIINIGFLRKKLMGRAGDLRLFQFVSLGIMTSLVGIVFLILIDLSYNVTFSLIYNRTDSIYEISRTYFSRGFKFSTITQTLSSHHLLYVSLVFCFVPFVYLVANSIQMYLYTFDFVRIKISDGFDNSPEQSPHVVARSALTMSLMDGLPLITVSTLSVSAIYSLLPR